MKHELKFPFVGSGDFKIYIYKEKETKGMKNEMKKKNNKGFSLVELIVVIAIMAVLMVVLAPAMLRYVEKSRVQKDKSAVAEVINAVNLAASEEAIADKIVNNVTITVQPKTGDDAKGYEIKGTADSSVITEVEKSIPKIDITSKTYKGRTYTITITVDGDGVISVPEYNEGGWSKKS